MSTVKSEMPSFIHQTFGSWIKGFAFHPMTKKAFHTLYKKIRNAHSKWLSVQITQSSLETKPGSEFVKLHGYDLIPKEIRMSIEHSSHYHRTYRFNINGKHCRMNLVIPSTESKSLKFFQDVVYKTFMWLSVATQYAPTHCSKELNIYAYFTDHKKTIAESLEPLDEIHANTAFTTACQPSTDIVLFRKEEWFKVLIHETFHSLGLDFTPLDVQEANRRILEMFPIGQKVELSESYSETWANIIHTLFVCFFNTRNKEDWDRISKKMEDAVKIEIAFSLFQCTKILHHYHLSYYDLIQLNCPLAKEARKKYKEKTNILAYYVIKTILLFHLNDFVQWCLTNNGASFLQFHLNPKNVIQYTQLIRNTYLEKQWMIAMQKMDDWFITNFHNTSTFSRKTMRLTCFD
jgi:hypothetical protein